ncbi:oxidoreductase [Mycobacterium sp. 852013-50091_SCH5140682]|uniref:FAD-dependent oxidoreductase n=1 Tax=Mycobacterium sp. 852013-50091_SCH5140682 TaxID=1834109 RepID=UPI0007E99064|nr:FAD-dependent oxidoreductase [Mycobacterium sp. 852013-50091_SCH5140682]OBC11597.1 oxidoreductase [Mycobacterium sp. 852013-50091_SCH5140682]
MTGEVITTPASCARRPSVAVLGAGIAGLTAAHELAQRGFDVTVYEPRVDERVGLGGAPPETYPPVKLGGLAASQYSTVGTHDGSAAELRPFPGRRGDPRPPARAVAGEHGFRFFPAYYLHTWDLFQRIPVYQRIDGAGGTVDWVPTARTIMDNVRRVVTQGTTVDGKPSLVFPREAPRTPAEFLTIAGQLTELGFTASDIDRFVSRLVRYLVTSPLRRAAELQNLSAYDFFVGRDDTAEQPRFTYSPRFDSLLLEMPRVLAAFDTRWGDARTNLTTYLQLQLQMDRRDNKADGVLNGPTTESWFDHWHRHLVELGVRFVRACAGHLEPPASDPGQPPHLRPRVQVMLADGTRLAPDYTVVAVDAPAAEQITAALRAAGTGGTVAGLDGFTTSSPPDDGPLQPGHARPQTRRDPYAMDEMGRVPWDRFQTLGGIQYYFDTEFQLLRGHMYYSGTEWALSSINQHGLWERRPTLARDGHVSVLSVDIGDFNTPSRSLLDESGRGKAARDCTADEIATEVWRQIVWALTSDVDNVAEALMPWPTWYALDRGLVMGDGPGQGHGKAVRNETPYLVPIVGDWENRPGPDPWNPHGGSWGTRPTEETWLRELRERNVWQARHGGYQVHHNSVVFAGTWTKTFTRMTSMEAACESARHAVNAILDHYIWVASGGTDHRENTTLDWRFPYDFLDQGYSSPVRMPSPAGDYCYVFDIENREPADARPLRTLDGQYCREALPHPLDTAAPLLLPAPGGLPMTQPTMPPEPLHLLTYLQAWRQYLQQAGLGGLGGALLTPPGTSAPAAPDYAQQLLTYLQAWRHYLEQTVGEATGRPSEGDGAPGRPPSPGEEVVAPADDYGIQTTTGRREPRPARAEQEPASPPPPAARRPAGSAHRRFTEADTAPASTPAPRSLYARAPEPGTARSAYPGITEPGWLDQER